MKSAFGAGATRLCKSSMRSLPDQTKFLMDQPFIIHPNALHIVPKPLLNLLGRLFESSHKIVVLEPETFAEVCVREHRFVLK